MCDSSKRLPLHALPEAGGQAAAKLIKIHGKHEVERIFPVDIQVVARRIKSFSRSLYAERSQCLFFWPIWKAVENYVDKMKSFVSGLLVICVLISSTDPSLSAEDEATDILVEDGSSSSQSGDGEVKLKLSDANEPKQGQDQVSPSSVEARSLTAEEKMEKKSKPLRSIFMGIYKNYKSTYLGNKTLTEYKQHLREKMKNKQQKLEENESIRDDGVADEAENAEDEDDEEIVFEAPDDLDVGGEDKKLELTTIPTENGEGEEDNLAVVTEEPDLSYEPITNQKELHLPLHNRKHSPVPPSSPPPELQYNVGPALNMSLDLDNSIVRVNLDGESLKELVTGRWLSDSSEEGNFHRPP